MSFSKAFNEAVVTVVDRKTKHLVKRIEKLERELALKDAKLKALDYEISGLTGRDDWI